MASFDRGVAGRGGPRLLREESHLPVLGCMAFSQHGINLLVTGLHEIGHVLGFGTIWEDLGFYHNPPDGDEHFNGPLATAAFDDAGGWDYTGKKVPVSSDGGHWRVPLLSGELMGPGGGGALSAITAQSMADLGYGVDATQADPYTLPGTNASAKIAAYQPAVSGPVFDVTRAHPDVHQGADHYGQEGVTGGFPSIVGDDGLTGRLDIAEQVWGRGVDFNLGEGRQMWGVAPPAYAEPKLSCGVGLMNQPIYVVDPQGRVVRTIRQ